MSPLIFILGAAALLFVMGGKKKPAIGDGGMGGGGGKGKPPPPTPETVEGPPDTIKAAELAPVVADDLITKGRGYDRTLMRAFQAAAGIKVDGLYGPQTRGALRHYLGVAGSPLVEPPDAIYGRGERAYTPPRGA